ncbi:hypothetical protein LN042_33725 [Kitasatospora sp. RB6PN24]|uniref:hypothetical protein n=1 Tax=Kitasatospora humi TaxID=2893891 RepID=UPI001E53FCDE|nr:hypothetical protein [Kitasatospora humi]MCC9311965.1 hypothetical protein [Kitasatospora humi]
MKHLTDAEFESSSIERAWERPEEVVVPYALAYSPHLQPEDYGVLIRLLLRDPEQPSGVLALAREFQASGWRMGASRLRGVLGRLQKAGHVSHERDGYDQETSRPKWRFRVYRNPANNSAYVSRGTVAASQVSPTVRNPTRRGAQVGSEGAISNICASQADGAVFNTSGFDGAVSDTSETNMCSGQADGAVSNTSAPSPPHPPVVGTPPTPPLPAATADVGMEGRGTGFAGKTNPSELPQDLRAVLQFLMELPAPYACGLRDARRFAPKLLEALPLLGYATPDEVLVYDLTHRPASGLNDPAAAIGARIDRLRPRHIVLRDRDMPRVADPRTAPDVLAQVPHCGDADCDPISRMREGRDAAGFLRLQPCSQCSPLAARIKNGCRLSRQRSGPPDLAGANLAEPPHPVSDPEFRP